MLEEKYFFMRSRFVMSKPKQPIRAEIYEFHVKSLPFIFDPMKYDCYRK